MLKMTKILPTICHFKTLRNLKKIGKNFKCSCKPYKIIRTLIKSFLSRQRKEGWLRSHHYISTRTIIMMNSLDLICTKPLKATEPWALKTKRQKQDTKLHRLTSKISFHFVTFWGKIMMIGFKIIYSKWGITKKRVLSRST